MTRPHLAVAATGHRWEKLGVKRSFATDLRLRDVAGAFLEQLQPDEAITGMALGWDTAWAHAALRLKIPLVAAIPGSVREQTGAWLYSDLSQHGHILRQCARVVVIGEGYAFARAADLRNRYMVDNAQIVCAMMGDPSSGSGKCVAYAESRGVPVVNLWGLQR